MDLKADNVVVSMTLQITRANNGAVETFDVKLTGDSPQRAPVVHDVTGVIEAQPAGMIQG
jgi:hypothetical protein